MEEDAEFSDPQIEAILLFEGNNKCNDCDEPNPKWTSINNAVFLCAKCARKHKKYPSTVSTIKSLEVDEFTKGEITMLRHGGNTRFKTLMMEYNIPLTKNNNEYKYKTKLADYYRKALSEETREGSSLLARPDKRTAIQMIEDDSIVTSLDGSPVVLNNPFENINNNFSDNINNPISGSTAKTTTGNQNYKTYDEHSLEDSKPDEFDNLIGSIGKMFSNVGDTLSNKMKEMDLDSTFHATKEHAKKLVVNSKEFITDKSQEISESQLFKKIQTKAETGFAKLFEKTAELIDKSNLVDNPTYSNPYKPQPQPQQSNVNMSVDNTISNNPIPQSGNVTPDVDVKPVNPTSNYSNI